MPGPLIYCLFCLEMMSSKLYVSKKNPEKTIDARAEIAAIEQLRREGKIAPRDVSKSHQHG